MPLPVKRQEFWILDFDIENRPLSYWQPDRPTAEVTAIAWKWLTGPKRREPIEVRLLTASQTDAEHKEKMERMLLDFSIQFLLADMVTGHYITRHDLPILNGALMDWNLPIFDSKLAQDTKTQMVRKADIPATQEYLAKMEHIVSRKIGMSQHDWRQANRLTVEGVEAARKRVVGDVRQHSRLRKAMLRDGLLHPARIWRP